MVNPLRSDGGGVRRTDDDGADARLARERATTRANASELRVDGARLDDVVERMTGEATPLAAEAYRNPALLAPGNRGSFGHDELRAAPTKGDEAPVDPHVYRARALARANTPDLRIDGLRLGDVTSGRTRAPEASPDAMVSRPTLAQFDPRDPHTMSALHDELARLGDPQPCRVDDTVASLARRVQVLQTAKVAARADAEANQIAIDDEGTVGSNEALRRKDLVDRAVAMNPGTALGAIFAGITAGRGGSREEIRAAGERGGLLEGLGGGVGVVVTTRAQGVDASDPVTFTERPLRAEESTRAAVEEGALAERRAARAAEEEVAAKVESTEAFPEAPGDGAEPETSAKTTTSEASASARAAILRARYVDEGVSIPYAKLSAEDRAKVDELLKSRDEARARLDELEAPPRGTKGEIDVARKALGEWSHQIGEAAAEAAVKTAFPGPPAPQKLWPPAGVHAGKGAFDQVWRASTPEGTKLVVVEAKGGAGKLGYRTVGGLAAQQGTGHYFKAVAREMARDTSSRDIGMELLDMESQIVYIKASTPIREFADAGGALRSSIRTTLREFDIRNEP